MISKKYAGIGSRKSPEKILNDFTKIATFLEVYGYTLRSGGAEGADSAFEKGCTTNEVFLPWKGFNKSLSTRYVIPEKAFEVAKQFHPRWKSLSSPVRKLMARNSQQVLGENINEHSDFIICWTADGKDSGGTGQALRIARHYDIRVFNLFNVEEVDSLRELLILIKSKSK